MAQGAKFGALVGLLWVLPHGLAMAGAHGTSVVYVLKNSLWHVFEQGLGGAVFASLLGARRRTVVGGTLAISALSVVVLGAARPALATENQGQVLVTLTGFESDKGWALIDLHHEPEAFPMVRDRAYRSLRVRVTGRALRLTFSRVPRGTYALSVHHDENANGKLDANFLGIPIESLGASNNARAFMGPPKWRDARFELNKIRVAQAISLKRH